MDKIQQYLQSLMRGRHGTDQLSAFLTFAGIICLVAASVLLDTPAALALVVLSLVLMACSCARIFSKDEAKRRKENAAFLALFTHASSPEKEAQKARKAFIKEKKKTHLLFKCPSCKSDCWVPKGKGKIRITCPKCGNKFLGKS